MTVAVAPGQQFEATIDDGDSGLVGDLGLLIVDNQGGTALAFSTTDVLETPALSGVYAATRLAPLVVGQYTLVWKLASTDETRGAEDLVVSGLPGLVTVPTAQPAVSGLCGAWTDGSAVLECCDAEAGSDGSVLDTVALEASIILNDLVGRRYPGFCEQNVRPCATATACGLQTLSRGHLVPEFAWDDRGWWGGNGGRPCGCAPLSRVKLPGYPVQSISEVLIDGVAVDPALYRVDAGRYLIRLADPDGSAASWPGCQRLDLADTEPGTFSVTYVFGSAPPLHAVAAANELACQLWKACPGNAGECDLPKGVVRIQRQGVTIERKNVMAFIDGGASGLVFVDAFLATERAKGPRRRPAVWSPDGEPFARRIG